MWLADLPKPMLELFDEVARAVVAKRNPDYHLIHADIHVRITHLPIHDSLRELRHVRGGGRLPSGGEAAHPRQPARAASREGWWAVPRGGEAAHPRQPGPRPLPPPQTHLNALINVVGVVTRRTAVFPQLKVVHFTCVKCGSLVGPFHQTDQAEIQVRGGERGPGGGRRRRYCSAPAAAPPSPPSAQVGSCPECESKGPFNVSAENTVYRNFQKMTLQESPGSVPPGRVPRYKDIILLADLIDAARPGEEVEVTGVYVHSYDASLNTRQGFPVFSTAIEANNVIRKSDVTAAATISGAGGGRAGHPPRPCAPPPPASRRDPLPPPRCAEEDRKKIQELSQKPDIVRRICHSIGPSIYGNEHAKLAVAMAMFGGREKNKDNKHRIRGDVNVLLLGDPGTAKSQLLKYVEKTSHRAVFTTGQARLH